MERRFGIDRVCFLQEIRLMSTTEAKDAGIPADVLTELEYAAQLAATGQKDPVFAWRIADEAARIREGVNRKHGLLDIGVAAIRELRDK
jgi:hypothetical protein